jgi:alcohol dehydrogenase class IV
MSDRSWTPTHFFGQSNNGGPITGEHAYLPRDKVIFGPGSASRLAGEVDRLGGTRVLLVTGSSLATRTDLPQRLADHLGKRCVDVFSKSVQHVPRASVLEATAQARDARIDLIVSFGGGSPIDTAKAVAMCLARGVTDESGLDRLRMRIEGGDLVVPEMEGSPIPHVSLPTTLSAGEHSPFAGITDIARQVKDAYGGAPLTPKVVILDPELCIPTPAGLFGSTGIRAIDHCVETVCSIAPSPFADALALRALEMLVAALPRAVADPEDITARGACLVAAWMSIFSLPNTPFGLSHAIGHQLGARCDVPHGITSAIMLPVAMDYNRPVMAARQALLAAAMGLDTAGLSIDEAARGASDRIRALVKQIGVKDRLRDWGVRESDLPGIAADAIEDFMVTTNPRPIENAKVIEDLLRGVL